MPEVKCLNCRLPVVTTYVPKVGTVWVHAASRWEECPPTYASPDFTPDWRTYLPEPKEANSTMV